MKDDRNKIRLKNKDCCSKGVQPVSERYPIQIYISEITHLNDMWKYSLIFSLKDVHQ